MKLLLVQPYGDNRGYDLSEVYEQVTYILNDCNEQIDLIVFPEAFEYLEDPVNEGWGMTREIAETLGVPVIVGASTAEGTEEAYYFNPNVKENDRSGDTQMKVYIKHSTSPRVYFDYNFDQETIDLIYKPLILNGQRIQICICHDMFYPLLMERFDREGMDILINLTGGNVKMSKWSTLLRGRSIEMDGAVICTMGNRTSMKQQSDRIVYDKGDQLAPILTYGDGEKEHAYSIFDLNTESIFLEGEPYYSKNEYTAFTVGPEQADVVFINGAIESQLKAVEVFEHSIRLQKGQDIIHVHTATEADLFDRTYVYKQPRLEKDHHVFIYFCDELEYSTAITLARMRAIENRIGLVIITSNFTIGAKTNRYKDVQLFRSKTIGFDLEHMYGFDSVYEKKSNSINGLNVIFKDKYEALIQDGQKALCLKREFPIFMTPEEHVRQNLLKEIFQKVPKEDVEVEHLIKKMAQTGEALRADIIVFDQSGKPFVVIECKEPSIALTLTVKEQVENYNAAIQAPYIAITNGHATEIYEQTTEGYKQLSINRLTDLLEQVSYQYVETAQLKRLSLEETTCQRNIQQLIYEGNISPVSTPKMQKFYAELYNAILTEPFQPTKQFALIEQIEDLDYGYYGFQNGSGKGGRFNMDYRNFKVTINGESIIYRITLAAAAATSNHEVYRNRTGSTSLCVGIQKKAHNAHVLELNLDTFTHIQNNRINIYHNGRCLQNHGIIELMHKQFPKLMQNDEILLGNFAVNESIQSKPFSYFVEALICYCHTRAKLKEQNKNAGKVKMK